MKVFQRKLTQPEHIPIGIYYFNILSLIPVHLNIEGDRWNFWFGTALGVFTKC